MADNVNHGIHINDLFMWCNDIADIKKFYSEVLGLKEMWENNGLEFGETYVVYKLSNDQSLHFVQREEPINLDFNWSYQPSSAIKIGIQKFSWTLQMTKNTLEEIRIRLEMNEIETYQKNITKRTGYYALTVLDPMGNTIDLYYLEQKNYE